MRDEGCPGVGQRQQRRIVGMHQVVMRKFQEVGVDLSGVVKALSLGAPEVDEITARLARSRDAIDR